MEGFQLKHSRFYSSLKKYATFLSQTFLPFVAAVWHAGGAAGGKVAALPLPRKESHSTWRPGDFSPRVLGSSKAGSHHSLSSPFFHDLLNSGCSGECLPTWVSSSLSSLPGGPALCPRWWGARREKLLAAHPPCPQHIYLLCAKLGSQWKGILACSVEDLHSCPHSTRRHSPAPAAFCALKQGAEPSRRRRHSLKSTTPFLHSPGCPCPRGRSTGEEMLTWSSPPRKERTDIPHRGAFIFIRRVYNPGCAPQRSELPQPLRHRRAQGSGEEIQCKGEAP